MVESRKEWIISRNHFWCLVIPPTGDALYTYERAPSQPQAIACLFPTSQSFLQVEQLIQHMYEEAALTLLLPEDHNDISPIRHRFLDSLQALSHTLQTKDPELYQHSLHVLHIVWRFLDTLHLPREFTAQVRIAALFHDIGKLSLSPELLQKPTGLTPEERKEIQKHVIHGAKMLLPIASLRAASRMVSHHHERWDGRGYPTGLRHTMIPLGARIIAIADAFAVMTTRRSYHAPCSLAEALNELSRCAGSQFDPILVEHFCTALKLDLLTEPD